MNEIKLFNFKNNQVSSLTYKDQIYFFPEEIGSILGFEDLSHSIRTSDGLKENKDFEVFRGEDLLSIKGCSNSLEQKGCVGNTYVSAFSNSLTLITETGLYKLILRSKKPDAEIFQDWVCSDVLPSIRKSGSYSTNDISLEYKNDPLVQQAELNLKHAIRMAKLEEDQRSQMMKQIAIQNTQLELQKQQIEQLTRINSLEHRSKEIECRTDAVLEQSGFYSILGYCNLVDRKVSIEEAAQLGRKAAKVSKLLGIEIKDTKDPRFGTVHIYHKDVLCQVIK